MIYPASSPSTIWELLARNCICPFIFFKEYFYFITGLYEPKSFTFMEKGKKSQGKKVERQGDVTSFVFFYVDFFCHELL